VKVNSTVLFKLGIMKIERTARQEALLLIRQQQNATESESEDSLEIVRLEGGDTILMRVYKNIANLPEIDQDYDESDRDEPYNLAEELLEIVGKSKKNGRNFPNAQNRRA
jgi:hypothetical protein